MDHYAGAVVNTIHLVAACKDASLHCTTNSFQLLRKLMQSIYAAKHRRQETIDLYTAWQEAVKQQWLMTNNTKGEQKLEFVMLCTRRLNSLLACTEFSAAAWFFMCYWIHL